MSSKYIQEQDVNKPDVLEIDPLETMPPAKKSMVIFFLVDTSKSTMVSKR